MLKYSKMTVCSVLTIHRNCLSFSAMCDEIVNWDFNSFASLESLQGFNQQCKIKCIRMVKIVFISGRCFVLFRRKNFVKRIHGQQSYPVNIQTFDNFFSDCCFTTGTATAYSDHKCVDMLTWNKYLCQLNRYSRIHNELGALITRVSGRFSQKLINVQVGFFPKNK